MNTWYLLFTGIALCIGFPWVLLTPKDLGFDSYYLNWLTTKDPAWLLGAHILEDDDIKAKHISLQHMRNFLLDKRSLEHLNLSGRNLKGINLKGYTLHKVHSSGALLDNANFDCARLIDVNLNGASLKSSSFSYKECASNGITLYVRLNGAKLDNARFSGPDNCNDPEKHLVIHGNIAGATLSNAKLTCITLINNDVAGPSPKAGQATLPKPYLSGGVNFSESTLDNVILKFGNFRYSKFNKASITPAFAIKKEALIDYSDFSEITACGDKPCIDLEHKQDSLTLVASKMKKDLYFFKSNKPLNTFSILCSPIDSVEGSSSHGHQNVFYSIKVAAQEQNSNKKYQLKCNNLTYSYSASE